MKNKSNVKNQIRRKTTGVLVALTLLTLSLVPAKSWSQVFLELGDEAGGLRAQSTFVYEFDMVAVQGIDSDQTITPIGNGLAILGGLGIAYLFFNRKKRD